MGFLMFLPFVTIAITTFVTSENIIKSFSTYDQEEFLLADLLQTESAGPKIDTKTYFKADRDFLLRQRAILKAFHHYRCPSLLEHDDFFILSKTYNPKDNLKDYEDQDLVNKYVTELEAGKYFGRYDPFTYEPVPVAQMKDLISILDNAFRHSGKLFYKTLAYFFTRINVSMLYTSICVITSSFRTEGYRVPPPIEAIPQIYTPKDIVYQANEMDIGYSRLKPLVLASRNGLTPPEKTLTYFREDANINAFHFLWHVDFPSWLNQSQWRYKKDRKGELFMNMHHNLLARYMAERIAFNYSKIEPIDILQPIYPPTNPNVLELNLREYPPRGPGILLSENYVIPDYGVNTSKTLVKAYETRIRQGIADGYFSAANGTHVSLRDPKTGSNELGNTLESGQESVDRGYYGNLHNLIHLIISRTTDPDGTLGLVPGYALHQENTIMDPVFFRIHSLVDTLNKEQLEYLPTHTDEELDYIGVNITSLSVQTKGIDGVNQLHTFYRNASWDVSNSIAEIGNKCEKIVGSRVHSNIRRIEHKDFTFDLNITSDKDRRAVLRIFMAPAEYFNGPYTSLDEFRWSFIEMDRFPVQLKAGNNKISRQSFDNSNAGAPYISSEELYKRVDTAYLTGRTLYVNRYSRTCGWPRNWFLPTGRPGNGMEFKLFAMATDFDEDFNVDFETAQRLQSLSMCGVAIGPYPDRRPMGFPFERIIDSWEEFYDRGNMQMIDVNIKNLG